MTANIVSPITTEPYRTDLDVEWIARFGIRPSIMFTPDERQGVADADGERWTTLELLAPIADLERAQELVDELIASRRPSAPRRAASALCHDKPGVVRHDGQPWGLLEIPGTVAELAAATPTLCAAIDAPIPMARFWLTTDLDDEGAALA
jgi:hypothetical protein